MKTAIIILAASTVQAYNVPAFAQCYDPAKSTVTNKFAYQCEVGFCCAKINSKTGSGAYDPTTNPDNLCMPNAWSFIPNTYTFTAVKIPS